MKAISCRAGGLDDLFAFDPLALAWAALPPAAAGGPWPAARAGLGMAAAGDGRVFVFGGVKPGEGGEAPVSAPVATLLGKRMCV